MKKNRFLIGAVFLVLAAVAFAQNEADFETDGNGTITKYVGWDTKIVISAKIGGKPVSAIGALAFSNNNLTSVVIPEGVISIGTNAFSGNSITTATLGANVGGNLYDAGLAYNIFCDYISNNRKAGTYTYRQKDSTEWPRNGTGRTEDGFIYIQTLYGIIIAAYNGSGVNALRIPESINKLPVRAILNLSRKYITRVQIPNSVTYIGDYAFLENQLTSVTIPDSVTSIGYRAFYQNNLTSVTIGNSVTYIGSEAFWRNDLESVTIPDSVTYIGSKAFYDNELTSVTIGNSVIYIGGGAFKSETGTNDLTSVTIPNSVTYIGGEAFWRNDLVSVTIPDSVTYIGSKAFYGNYNLASVTVRNTVPPTVGSEVFRTVVPIYVPAGSVDAYKAADGGWKEYASQISAIVE